MSLSTSKLQLTDLYEDGSKSGAPKPLTALRNPFAPQKGVHLYHFGPSFYSAEARLLLEEKNVPYTSHQVCIIANCYEQYDPSYVRLNPRCVVPTLVVDGEVTTDAHNMIHYAEEAQLTGKDAAYLVPHELHEKELCEQFFKLARSVFIEALSFGDIDDKPAHHMPGPAFLQKFMKTNHAAKKALLEKRVKQYAHDAYLKEAYEAKLSLMNQMVQTLESKDSLETIVEETRQAITLLNKQLKEGPISRDPEQWLCGPDYCKADMLWGLVLYRLKYRNLEDIFWPTYPAVEHYAQRLIARPAFQKAVVAYSSPSYVLRLILFKKLKQHAWFFALVAATAAAAVVGLNQQKDGAKPISFY